MNIGILGAGQLGRMLAVAGVPLGIDFRFFDPAANSPAARLGLQYVADYDDPAALEQFSSNLDLVTYEFENVPVTTVEFLSKALPIYPPPSALAAAQDRLIEKRFFQNLGIPTAPYIPVSSYPELEKAWKSLGTPALLKTRRMGYDGKGQIPIHTAAELRPAWESLVNHDLILEGFVAFQREVSILAVRGRDGSTCFYPLVENLHRGGILRRSLAPATALTPELQELAESYAGRAFDALGYIGVLAIELFVVEQDGQTTLFVNEMAPRVHNSGHWTIEGAETSQFENHLRAIAGLPLGSTALRGASAMLNLIGNQPEIAPLLKIPGLHLHLYQKAPRPGRKIGHLTLRADDPARLLELVAEVEALIQPYEA